MPRRGWSRLWRASMLSVASLGAAGAAAGGDLGGDARLPDAVQRRDTQAVQSLLAERADVNMRQGDGATALHWAAYLEDADTAALLIRAGADVNARNNLVSRRWRSLPSKAAPSSSSDSSRPAPRRTTP